ncbi:antitoxin [Jongsikchunia kroppenstedtii]|uniref:antitoxin n=1 Tax=Jongsikchunia kroppenstedtii TaxID=1121721 RepID=UPI000364850B|nr:antitoxin [Jongsikchunia kroppenstedtii]
MADIKGLVDKAKGFLGSKTGQDGLAKGADAVKKATGGKFDSQVDKGVDAAKKFAGGEADKSEGQPS